ncbi:hypothetical protein DFA_10639 [Cavenderia fasciculata]|uniref:Uncharacterized protein n=1 Tax=Cavenderia fasciculata TaxID=261658 RepID=F4QAZ4_CACFS|nr:uncharacterized protein DFA_10639 [Cavenderia fasciculata]EGG14766.1 hypothetical protein DFA_10639 [Cavenderia fasciculata]|eukprot:XP_004351282.1 hypothetical protein DFA_10639 [Cavenderia fasciculata]
MCHGGQISNMMHEYIAGERNSLEGVGSIIFLKSPASSSSSPSTSLNLKDIITNIQDCIFTIKTDIF